MKTTIKSLSILLIGLAAMVYATGCASTATRGAGFSTPQYQPTTEQPIQRVNLTLAPDVAEKIEGNDNFSSDAFKKAIVYELTGNGYMAESGQEASTSLEVTVTKIRVRNTFNAIMWGGMAGSDYIDGTVSIVNATGLTLDQFNVHAAYSLGGLAGGQDGVRMSWLYEAFAEEIVDQFKPEK